MVQGHQGLTRLQHRPQAGLVRVRAVPTGAAKGRHEFPLAFVRASFQRASVPETHVFPVPDEDDQRAEPPAEQFQYPLSGAYRPEGDTRQGRCGQVHRGDRAVRAHHERQRLRPSAPPHLRRDHRNGHECGTGGEILFSFIGRYDLLAGHLPLGGGNVRRRQHLVPAHAFRHGRPAVCCGDRQPLREALDRPLGLPPLVRLSGGAAALLQPPVQPVRADRQQRGELAAFREERPQHAVAFALLPLQPDKQGVDRRVPERSAQPRPHVRPRPLQRDGVVGRPRGAETHQERHGQPARGDGVYPAPQHGGLPDALLGGHTGQRGRLSGRGKPLHVHRAGGLFLHRRNQLPLVALPVRYQDGR